MTVNKCYTVKRLKEELEGYPDDMKVLMYTRGQYGWRHTGIEELQIKHFEIYDDDIEKTIQKSILSIGGNDHDEQQVLDFFWIRKEEKRKEAQKERDRLKELTTGYDFLSNRLHAWEEELLEEQRKQTAKLDEYYTKVSKEFSKLEKEIESCNDRIYYLTR